LGGLAPRPSSTSPHWTEVGGRRPPGEGSRERNAGIAHCGQLAPVTSPLVGEVGSRAVRAGPEGGRRPAEYNTNPPPHPSPTRGEGAGCGSASAKRHSLSNLLDPAAA